jgi:glucosyl-dolichyl phosphate glucuronosyltransferase
MEISVIICAYTEERWAELINAVESVQHQTLPASEIILSIDHNVGLYQRARQYFPERIRIVQNSGPKGLSGARNSGIAASKGSILAFLDDDAIAAPDWLSMLCTHFDSENVLGVGGSVHPSWPGETAAWFPEEFLWVIGCSYKGLPEKTAVIRNPMGGCMGLRREIFSGVGGFRDGIGRIGRIPLGCEETELCIRASQKWPERIFLYEPKSQIFHLIPAWRLNTSYFLSRCYAEGISKSYISYIIGHDDGLSSERTYTFQVLPAGVLKGLADGIRGDLPGFARSFLILSGFSATVFGYLVGKIMLLRGAGSQFDLEVKPL